MKKCLWMSLILFSSLCFAHKGIVVSEHRLASRVGAQILAQGGNAIDAAVAVGYALAVVNPCCGNLGGGGFMLIHFANGKNTFINFREKAPSKLHAKMFLDAQGQVIPKRSQQGFLAVGIPGTVLGFEYARTHYGTLPRKALLQGAYRLAKHGFIVSNYLAQQFQHYANDFSANAPVAAIFLRKGRPYNHGERLIQTDLAKTIADIANVGPSIFYHGRIAKDIVRASQMHGGVLTYSDFANYRVQETTPIYCTYKGLKIISSPPPASGGITFCELLNILENFPLKQMGFQTTASTQVIIEAMRYAYTDRNQAVGDPKYVSNDVKKLISKRYAKTISEQIKQYHDNPDSLPVNEVKELTDTTHYSIVDQWGNAVSVTYTLNGFFGAGVIAPPTGFFLNNQIDDFTIKVGVANKFGLVQQDKNKLQPGKQPLSSMTPTIILNKDKLFLVFGSPGGPRIMTALLLTFLNYLEYGKSLQTAVALGRFHYQVYPNFVSIEDHAIPTRTLTQLKKRKYTFLQEHTWGAIEAIVMSKQGKLTGVNDPRRPDGGSCYGEIPLHCL